MYVKDLLLELHARLKVLYDEADTARKVSVNHAIEAEGAMQSRYSTWKEESQYLAGGQMRRLVEIEEAMSALLSLTITPLNPGGDMVVLGSYVRLRGQTSGGFRNYLIVPEVAGGFVLTHAAVEGEITTVSTLAPVGKLLLRKEEGDLVRLPSSNELWEVAEVV